MMTIATEIAAVMTAPGETTTPSVGAALTTTAASQNSTGSPRQPKGFYPVGYRKPPAEYRVKPGQCLNPTGRPKGAKNKPKPASSGDVRAMILREARRQVTVSDAQGPVTMSMVEMVYRSLGLRAAKGSVRAGREFVSLAREAEREEASERTSVLLAIAEYKLEFERRRRALGKNLRGSSSTRTASSSVPRALLGSAKGQVRRIRLDGRASGPNAN